MYYLKHTGIIQTVHPFEKDVSLSMEHMYEEPKTLYEYINIAVLNSIGHIINVFPALRKDNNSYILCYHSVSDSGWRFSTGINEFEEQIAYLSEHYTIRSLSEILEGKQGVCITFDDGYEDLYTNALPILKKYRVNATVFIIGDTQNADRGYLQNELPLLKLNQIHGLKANDWELGFHSQTHKNLVEMSAEELVKEIAIGKTETEKKLGEPLDYFAYPLGLFNKKVVNITKEAGFKAAFSVNGGKVHLTNKFEIDRVPVEGYLTIHQFAAIMSPLGLFIGKQFMKILQLKESIISLLRLK